MIALIQASKLLTGWRRQITAAHLEFLIEYSPFGVFTVLTRKNVSLLRLYW